MIKKLALLFFSLFILIGSFLFYQNHSEKQKMTDYQWQRYQLMDKDGKIEVGLPHKDEQKISMVLRNNRIPASKHPITPSQRKIIGEMPKGHQLIYKNKPKANWKSSLAKKLLLHRYEKSRVYIKSLGSLLEIKNKEAYYIEKVLISTFTQDGTEHSFNAYVDSQTGDVRSTWNRTIHEKFGKRQKGLKLKAFQ